jgi:hypothetical protein
LVTSRSNEIKYPEVSLKQVFEIGLNESSKWSKDANLVLLTSVDENEEGSKGISGRRRDWNLMFKSSKKSEVLILTIRNGKLKEKDVFHNEEILKPIEFSSLKIDSTKVLIEQAQKEYKLIFGSGYIHGFHFSLEKSDEKLISSFLSVAIILISSYNNSAYAETTYYNQDVTAYVAATGALTYHGTTPLWYQTIAVHPNNFGNPNSGTILPYGTVIYVPSGLSSTVKVLFTYQEYFHS